MIFLDIEDEDSEERIALQKDDLMYTYIFWGPTSPFQKGLDLNEYPFTHLIAPTILGFWND